MDEVPAKKTISWQGELSKLVLALIFALYDYFYIFLTHELGLSLENIFSGTFSLLENPFQRFFTDNFAVLPLIVFWVLVGVIAYLFYFSLEVVYFDIHYYFELRRVPHLFGAIEEPRRFRIFATRALAHFLVTALYLLFIITTYLFIFPVARYSYLLLEGYFASLTSFPVAIIGPVVIWYIVFNILFFLYHRITATLKDEKYWEEHNLTA